MSDKYYNNDIKKRLGIDQTRTASQKLLDQVNLGKRLFKKQQIAQQQETTKKKPKFNEEKADCVSVKQKILKNIRNPANLTKLIKAINILTKCLNDQQFIKQNYKKLQEWVELAQLMRGLTIFENKLPAGTLLQIRSLMHGIDQVLLLIKNKVGAFKSQQLRIELQKQQKAVQNNANKLVDQLVTILDAECYLCRLYTDDSFEFITWFTKFKQLLFKQFQKLKEANQRGEQAEKVQQKDENGKIQQKDKSQKWQYRSQIINCLFKIFKVPITTQLESTRTSICTMLKQTIYNYKDSLFAQQQDISKQFLDAYNRFLNKRDNKIQVQNSYSIMGNGGVSRQDRSLQTGGGADTWINKQ